MPHQNPIRRFSLALSLFAVQLIVFTSTVVTADQLIILRSGNRPPEPEPTLTTLHPDDPASEVAGGTSCTVAEDCPLLEQSILNACGVRTCVEGFCDVKTACSPIERCDGAGVCEQVATFDELLTYLPGPENAPFSAEFTPEDFDAARSGLAPRFGANPGEGCVNNLLENPLAEIVWTDVFALNRPNTSALFAIDFDITDPTILSASIDLYIRANDTLGGGLNQGVYINGFPLSGDTTGGDCFSVDAFNIYRDDIAPLLHVGTNTLYLNVTHTTLTSGIVFTGEFRIDTDGPSIIHVMEGAAPGGDGSTWGAAFSTIGEAIDEANTSLDPNREIWISAGTYTPTGPIAGPRTATLNLIKDVDLYGGFAGDETERSKRDSVVNITTISGDLNNDDVFDSTHPTWNDNVYHILTADRFVRRTSIHSINLVHAKANGTNINEDRGAALFCRHATHISLVDCKINENYATHGGALYFGQGGSAELIGCELNDNKAASSNGAIRGKFGTRFTLVNTNIMRNSGVGVWMEDGGSLSATNCRFEDNIGGNGGAIYCDSIDDEPGIDIILTGCTFIRNRAGVGAIYHNVGGPGSSASLTITQCHFEGNVATSRIGGAIRAFTDGHNTTTMTVDISDTTFLNNRTNGGQGGAIYTLFADAQFRRCRFTNNEASFGGAIYALYKSPLIEDCWFERNIGSSNGGGAIRLSFGDGVDILDSTFIGNVARDLGGAISVGSSYDFANIERCTFLANTAIRGGAISSLAPVTDIKNSLFIANDAGVSGGGVDVRDGVIDFTNCTFYANTAGTNGGGVFGQNSVLNLHNCIARANTDGNGGGFTAQAFADATTVIDPRYSNIEGVALTNGNIDEDPLFVELPSDGGDGWGNENDNYGSLHLLPGSPCIDSGDNAALIPESITDLDGAPRLHDDTGMPDTGIGTPPIVDMGCYEFQERTTRLIYVDDDGLLGGDGSNWEAAYRYFQDALASAGAGDTIFVAEGTHRPDEGNGLTPGDREATFQLVQGTEVLGGYAGIGADDPDARNITGFETILSGDIGVNQDVSDNSFHVIVASGTSPATVLDGLTISGGYANGMAPTTDNGGGFYSDGGSPMLHNCTLDNNYASADGGGAYVTSGAPSFEHCTFVRNGAGSTGGGIAIINGAQTRLVSCRFFINTSVNGGGAMQNQSSHSVAIRNSLFVGNSTGGDGGAINSISSTPIITNNVVVQNEAGGVGGGIAYNQATFLIMASTIVWNNVDNTAGTTTDQISVTGATFIASTNCVQDFSLAGIAGNISEDPMLLRRPYDGGDGWGDLNDDFGDLHLLPGSPCIDAGNNAVLPESVVDDHDGNPRFHDDPTTVDTGPGDAPIVDMGAFEFRPADCDHSGDTGLIDLADLLPCLLGPETEVSPECACFDLNNDGLVNLRDVALFQEVYGLP